MGLFRKPHVFLATPFSAERAGGEDADIYDRVQASIRTAVGQAGVVLDHPGDVQRAGKIMSQVFEGLDEADVVMGVVTGNNPNVLFEIGAAPSELILIVDDPDKLPFDLKGYRSIPYGRPGELETLTARIVNALHQTIDAQAFTLDPPIEEYLAAVEQQTRVMSYLLPDWLSEPFEGRLTADLRHAYVPTRLQPFSLGGDVPQTEIDAREIFAREKTGARSEHLLIVGESGSGKTTLLRMLAARAWSEPQTLGLDEPWLPLLVTVRSLAMSQSVTVDTRLKMALDEDNQVILTKSPPEDFLSLWNKRTRRRWLFLIDGLDEAGGADRGDLFRWIAGFLDYATKNGYRVVLASRPLPEAIREFQSRAAVFRIQPLDVPQFETLSRTILGPDADAFLQAVPAGRLRMRLRNPLLLTVAAAIFYSTRNMPPRRAELFEKILDTMLELANDRRLRKSLGDSIAAGTRVLLERLAITASDRSERTVADFLKIDLGLPEVEATGRASFVLRELVVASGILAGTRTQYTFAHVAFLEHLAASALVKKFTTWAERSDLIKSWWNRPGQREITLTFLGLLNDTGEVTRLIRAIYPNWLSRRFNRQGPTEHLDTLAFIVDCILDGCLIDPSLERDIAEDLLRLTDSREIGPRASELLALLGNHGPLIKWAKLPTFEPMPVCYAIAALSRLNEEELLNGMVWDEALPLKTRLAVLGLMAGNSASRVVPQVIENSSIPDVLRSAAVAMLIQANRKDDVLQLLRAGHVQGETLNVLAVACAERYELDILVQTAYDPQLPAAIRERVGEAASLAAAMMARGLAEDDKAEPAVRASAASLVGDRPDETDLGPLLTNREFSPSTRISIALFALNRARSALMRICNRMDLPRYVPFFVVTILAGAGDFDALDRVAGSENAIPDARSMALTELFAQNAPRAVQIAASISSSSGLYPFARQMLQKLVRDEKLSNEQLVALLAAITEAASSDIFVDLIESSAIDARIAKIALLLAERFKLWTLLVGVARYERIPLENRAFALKALADNHRNAELEAISAAEEVQPGLRALAEKLLTMTSPDNSDPYR